MSGLISFTSLSSGVKIFLIPGFTCFTAKPLVTSPGLPTEKSYQSFMGRGSVAIIRNWLIWTHPHPGTLSGTSQGWWLSGREWIRGEGDSGLSGQREGFWLVTLLKKQTLGGGDGADPKFLLQPCQAPVLHFYHPWSLWHLSLWDFPIGLPGGQRESYANEGVQCTPDTHTFRASKQRTNSLDIIQSQGWHSSKHYDSPEVGSLVKKRNPRSEY